MGAGRQRMRLILCGICFLESCPWSKWVTEDDDGTMEAVDELHMLFIECQHSEMDKAVAANLTQEERQERINEAIAQIQEETGQPVEIANLDELLGDSEVKAERTETETITEKDFSVDDILRKFSEHIERENGGEQQNQKGH
jgi:epoxyqueuosine reductase QueG